MLPMAESACSELCAAVLEAKVSGKEVPRATKVMAVTGYLMESTHPNRLANSATIAVTTPMKKSEIPKAQSPLP